MKTTNDLERPEFVTFLATIPHDAELAALGETYAAAMEKAATLQERTDADRAEMKALDASLIDAPSNMAKLLSRRAELMQSLDVWPGVLAEAMRRRALCHLYYLAALRRVALAEAHRANDALEPARIAILPIARRLRDDESRFYGAPLLTPDQRTALLAEVSAIHRRMQADRAALQLAQETVRIADARAQMRYGDGLKLEAPHTWADAMEQRTRQMRPPVVGSRVHA